MAADDQEQRVLPPSGKRRNEFRRRGEIPLSRDVVTLLTIAGGVAGTALCSTRIVGALRAEMITAFTHLDLGVGPAIAGAAATFLTAGLPVAAGALVGYLVAAAPQLGWPPVLRPLGFHPHFISGQAILGIISPKAALGRVVKSAVKVAAVGGAAAVATVAEVRGFMHAPALDPLALAGRLAASAAHLALYSGLALAVLAAVDYVQQRRSLMKRMRMTREEAKREHREMEGDPGIKRRRRKRMRELAKRRVARAVQQADVVLVNPTEYAVALRYKSDEDRAPRVLAKGRGAEAERIRELARQHGVPIIPAPPLCRLIHKLVPEGGEIPGQLYRAVAEVLAYVYRLRRRAQ